MEKRTAMSTHGACAAKAETTSVSVRSVRCIWRPHGYRPHRFRQLKLSKDPL